MSYSSVGHHLLRMHSNYYILRPDWLQIHWSEPRISFTVAQFDSCPIRTSQLLRLIIITIVALIHVHVIEKMIDAEMI